MDSIKTFVQWPPEFTIRFHPRARHVKLKTSSRVGLELVLPVRFDMKNIPFILEKNRAWIEKQLTTLQKNSLLEKDNHLPSCIDLPAINKKWQVNYVLSKVKLQLLMRPHQQLVVLGNINDTILCKKLLINWIKNQAKVFLIEQFQFISQEIHLPFKAVTIRDQATRWGSCSSQKSINLNYKLLFLSYALMRHIIIHELCHTVHLNHSDDFWQLVKKFDPQCEFHRKQMRTAETSVPQWINRM